jgi:hypothetical protein
MRALVAGIAIFAVGCVTARPATAPLKPAAHAVEELDPFAPFTFAVASPEDAVVRVLAPSASCTGTLIEDDLVLTAHHCVVQRGAKGEYSTVDLKGSDLQVELGGDYLPWGTIGVKDVVAPPCGEAGGDGDIAVLVLDRKLVGMSTMERVADKPKIGQTVDPAGFGRCALSGDGIHRSIREGGTINEVRPGTLTFIASICPGDSGGPVFERGTRRVVGVVSTSAMDSDAKTKAPSVIARIDTYSDVFSLAHEIANGASKNERPPLTCTK